MISTTESTNVLTMFHDLGISVNADPVALNPNDIPAVDFYFEKAALLEEENEKLLEKFIISNTETGWSVIGRNGDMPLSKEAAISPLGKLMEALEVGFEHVVRIN